jgi:hypothetical protein
VIRVVLPAHLRNLAGVAGEVELEVPEPATLAAALDALEARHPVLRGTIRDAVTGRRRPLCASTPAAATCRTSRPTSRCPSRSCAPPSRCS